MAIFRDHYKVDTDGMIFQVVNERGNTVVCYTYWRCNADAVCSALNAYVSGPMRKPNVDDVNRRSIELLHEEIGERTFASVKRQLISEFGENLVEASRVQNER